MKESGNKLRVCVFTSSRADYGIYRPLLAKMTDAPGIEFGILAFGTHTSASHGRTINSILEGGYPVWGALETLVKGDSPESVADSMGLTLERVSRWLTVNREQLDIILVLGDRYEMFAAASATVPFNIPLAHLYGGEETRGAIDDKFRHCLTVFSTLHFTSTERYKDRVIAILGSENGVTYTGSLSLDGIRSFQPLSLNELDARFGIDFRHPTILVTYHPETVAGEHNFEYIEIICRAIKDLTLRYQVVVTLPNADTFGVYFRKKYSALANLENVKLIENFGKVGYFSAVHYSKFVMGNSSSGIMETASLTTYAINIGQRQAGRIIGDNVISVPNDLEAIHHAVNQLEEQPSLIYEGLDPYYLDGHAADKIISSLRKWYSDNL